MNVFYLTFSRDARDETSKVDFYVRHTFIIVLEEAMKSLISSIANVMCAASKHKYINHQPSLLSLSFLFHRGMNLSHWRTININSSHITQNAHIPLLSIFRFTEVYFHLLSHRREMRRSEKRGKFYFLLNKQTVVSGGRGKTIKCRATFLFFLSSTLWKWLVIKENCSNDNYKGLKTCLEGRFHFDSELVEELLLVVSRSSKVRAGGACYET